MQSPTKRLQRAQIVLITTNICMLASPGEQTQVTSAELSTLSTTERHQSQESMFFFSHAERHNNLEWGQTCNLKSSELQKTHLKSSHLSPHGCSGLKSKQGFFSGSVLPQQQGCILPHHLIIIQGLHKRGLITLKGLDCTPVLHSY